MKRILFFGLPALLLLAGCAGAPPDAAIVAVEATAVPTLAATDPPATAAATATPQSTATEEPTTTPPPTSTPTDTPAPTKTPTATPEPTESPTFAPSATSPPAPTSAPPTPSVDTAAVLREQLNTAIAELGVYSWEIWEGFRTNFSNNATNAVRCQPIVNVHDHILTLFSLDVSGSSPTVQNAQAKALEGVRSFDVAARDWTDSCRQALAMGNETNIMNYHKASELLGTLGPSEALWNQAIHMLDE